MHARSIRVRPEDRSSAERYLGKARDNHEAMVQAFEKKNYNAVGTLAVQTVISSADAVCVFEKGVRSISQDHGDICDLVLQTRLPDVQLKCGSLKRVITKKNVIRYECRDVTSQEAADLVKLAGRFFEWVETQLGLPTNG